MKPVEKTIWYIESHYHGDIDLDVLARAAGVSRFHLSHAFSYATGMPVIRYLRWRRLSQAVRALAAGESDILNLAFSRPRTPRLLNDTPRPAAAASSSGCR